MLPRALAQWEIIFLFTNRILNESRDLGEHNGKLYRFIGALHEEKKQRENLLCLFIAFFHIPEKNIAFYIFKCFKITFWNIVFVKKIIPDYVASIALIFCIISC